MNKINNGINNNNINIEKIPEIKDDNKIDKIDNVQPSITIKKETKEETIIVQKRDDN